MSLKYSLIFFLVFNGCLANQIMYRMMQVTISHIIFQTNYSYKTVTTAIPSCEAKVNRQSAVHIRDRYSKILAH